jgi:hypothetical protein
MMLPLVEWEFQPQPGPGMYSYPFTFDVPAWLPASMFLASYHDSCALKIRYKLIA